MINFFRGFLVLFCIVLLGFGAVILRYTVMLIVLILIRNKDKRIKICSEILHKSWKMYISFLELCTIIKLDIKNSDKIINIKNSIIVSTHPSLLDIVILISIIPNTTCFVAEKLARNPFFKGMVDLLFILESNNIEEWEKKSLKFLEKGYNLVIFPMGSRHNRNEYPKIRKGAALLAQKSKKNISVLKIENDFDFLSKNKPAYRISLKPVNYVISYIDEVNINEMQEKYPDEVTCRKEITNIISKNLYQ